MEVLLPLPHREIADHEENTELSDHYDKNAEDLIINCKVNIEKEIIEHDLRSDSLDLGLREMLDENTENGQNDKILEPIANIMLANINNTIIEYPKDNISDILDCPASNEVLPHLEIQESPVKTASKKRKLVIESDSENESNTVTIQKPYKLIDSESEVSMHCEESPVKRKLIDSDSESRNSSASIDLVASKKVKKLKKRKDHKTTNQAPFDSDDDNEVKQNELITRVDEKEMIAIKSESQKTIREHMVEIPCHKPRTFTLKEFLQRKTIVKPTTLIKEQVKAFKSNGNIKMNQEELKVFAKKIEQRKRDIRSFFKSQTTVKSKVETHVSKSPDKVETLSVETVLEMPVVSTKDIDKENVINELNTPMESKGETNNQAESETKINKQDKIAQLSNIKSEVRLSFNYDENSFIDLESGSVVSKKIESKAEQFMNRVLKHMNASKKKKSMDENEELKRLIDCDEEYKMDVKPRGSYIKLKKQLEERIMEEKKLKFKLHEKELNDKEDDDEEEEMEEYNEKLEEDEEQDEVFDEDEEAVKLVNEDQNNVDDEDEQEDDDLNGSQENSNIPSETDEEEPVEEEDKTKTFSRIKPSEDLDSSDNENNPEIDGENHLELIDDDKLFSEDIADGRDVEDELLGLCSGRFDTQPMTMPLTVSSQAPTTFEDMPSISVSSVAKDTNDSSGDDEDNDRIGAKKNRKSRKIVLSEDEDDGEIGEPLELSDNEDEEDEEPEPNAQTTEYNDEEEEMIITYDSDENDIALTVGDYEQKKKMKIQNFIENEAELSESDWNSEDEDEKGADNYDIELGDEEQFDAQKLKSELAQIHMRRMLNDDEREVQMIQDLIMPDQEENDVRERKFRWKNLDNPLVDGHQSAENPEVLENHSEDESEEYYRKLRFERETLLQHQPDDLDPASILIKTDSQETDKPKGLTKRISIIKNDRNKISNSSSEKSFLIGSKNSPLITRFRDSFLARGEQHLSSLEQLTIEKLEKCAAIETAITTEKSSKLFFVIDDDAKTKRKPDDMLQSTVKRKKIS